MYKFGSYILKIKLVVVVFHQKFFMHCKGHQMMTFRAGCGPSTRKRDVTKQRMCICVIKAREAPVYC